MNMTAAQLSVLQPARNRNITVTDGGVAFNLEEDRELHATGLCRDAHELNAAEILERLLIWLDNVAPTALVKVVGTIPPGHPLGVPATRPNGQPL